MNSPDNSQRQRGGRRRTAEPPTTNNAELRAWFSGNLPDDWFVAPPTVAFDRDEILVTGVVAEPKVDDDVDAAAASTARIDSFRESTREHRMAIAQRAQQTFVRTVSWAVTCGEVEGSFTRASVPVMTRLPMEERALLDTLIAAGVARTRSEALAWCVRLVADNESDWLGRLREAMTAVNEVRQEGPASR
jgi:hypothetical protein